MSGRFGKLEMQERPRESAVAAEQMLGTPVRTPQDDLALATSAWQSGEFERALQMYTRALRGDRALVPAWVGQVQMLVELGEYPEARLWADKSLELFKNNGDLLATKAQACQRAGDTFGAMECSDASMQSAGSSALRWRARGEVLLSKAAERARDCFEKSLAEPGAGWFERVLIARVYLVHRLGAAAISYAQQGSDMQPGSAYAWLVLGRCQESLGMREKATASYGRSLQLPGGQAAAATALREMNEAGRLTSVRRWLGGVFKR